MDFDKGDLHISRRVDAYRDEGAPKTAAGLRSVPLGAHLVAALRAWRMESKFKKPADLIFPNSEGNHIGHDNLIKRRFLPLFETLEAAHVQDPGNNPAPPKRFNWHGQIGRAHV